MTKKKLLTITASILVTLLVAFGTAWALYTINKGDNSTVPEQTSSPEATKAQADEAYKKGLEAKEKGQADAAIEAFKDAKKHYETTEDPSRVAEMDAQINYMEHTKKQDTPTAVPDNPAPQTTDPESLVKSE